MYKLIRRISSSFFPRADRPWNDDGESTSNAPQVGQKRRLGTPDLEDLPSPQSAKRLKAEKVDDDEHDTQGEGSSARAAQDSEDVKEVTKGVREVELEEGEAKNTEAAPGTAATVPLPASPELKPQAEESHEKDTVEGSSPQAEKDESSAKLGDDLEDESQVVPVQEGQLVEEVTKEAEVMSGMPQEITEDPPAVKVVGDASARVADEVEVLRKDDDTTTKAVDETEGLA
ncbi:hypothetical protein PHLCEN_2v6267 [Hermanssonia centrifuga]|uniref:Uncharacterized protein n=1 Tax=Hermanssonia centrifuga TaxID=98765 RepID=A0A2R6NZY2_9APHY|nr:hypothetical protein PHLCEN_2v6267 [Hermanssonia centrifuga]